MQTPVTHDAPIAPEKRVEEGNHVLPYRTELVACVRCWKNLWPGKRLSSQALPSDDRAGRESWPCARDVLVPCSARHVLRPHKCAFAIAPLGREAHVRAVRLLAATMFSLLAMTMLDDVNTINTWAEPHNANGVTPNTVIDSNDEPPKNNQQRMTARGY